jgi:hypothetical protein
MNHHAHKLTHEKAVAAGLVVLRSPYAIRYEVETAARALERASIQLRAVPAFPECEDIRRSYQAHYDECVADMKKALEDV